MLLWDMPGYGASISAQTPPLDLVAQRRCLAALLQHWELSAPDVVAHDVGGAVALGAHLLESVPMSSLYLLDVVTLDPWGSPFFRLVAQHQEAFAALPENLHAALVREYIGGASHVDLDAGWPEELARPWTTPDGQREFYRQVAALSPTHTRPIVERLDHVACPVRVGWGEDDPWIPVAQAGRLADLVPRTADVVTFPGAGHLVPLEAPEPLARDIAGWLGRVGDAR